MERFREEERGVFRTVATLGDTVGLASGIPEQSAETFFVEMAVVRKNLGYTLAAHDDHRYTVCRAIALVGACPIQVQAVQKQFMALRDDHNTRVFEETRGEAASLGANTGTRFCEERLNAGKSYFVEQHGVALKITPKGTPAPIGVVDA